MLTTAPRLRIRRPSPTTAEFTVTTLPPRTLPLRLLWLLLLALRISLSLVALLILYARWSTPAGTLLARIAASVSLPVLIPIAAAVFYALSLRVHKEESLLVLRGLGVQTSESPATYLAGAATRFIPTEKIQDILVNEAFLGFEVRYYLVVVVEGEENVVVVFPGLLPRRKIVETVWRGVRECLYEGRGEDRVDKSGS
ncbi:hypothetical protein BBK36DRAFT_1131402 [Trichoderma citrinoviride]|uniref:Phosphatidylinositol N-acetylglucosaminyltransferase subunit H conserved domain-containing protein n=1 Tax=Trichoderma citrinoviride TaxID=58853 RepID=A0A2T4AX56_9HYPO|nr:hypothetical protein BBK36DRAFT_1131402 [Trichoderma citrinoviride]PTB61568.1 hypothetical protein BBK36DRAFT_1131402 [Trichoderma citrinoviride]